MAEALRVEIAKLDAEKEKYEEDLVQLRHGHEYDRMEENLDDVERELKVAKEKLNALTSGK